MCEGHVMSTSGVSQNYIQCFLTNNRRKSVSRKIQYWPCSSVTTRMLLATSRFSQLLLYREEGGTSQLLVAWSSFGRLCRLSIASACKEFGPKSLSLEDAECFSRSRTISHFAIYVSSRLCKPEFIDTTFPIIPETPKGRASWAAARSAGL